MVKPGRDGETGAPKRRGRSHPPSLVTLAERTLRDEAALARGSALLCACSGGPDSTALLHVLAMLRDRLDFRLIAHGVDHGLRPEAASELALAAELAARLRVPFEVTRVEVPAGSNLQARARGARLSALAAAAVRGSAQAIATGHTADDRAETLLLRLLRGAGPRGLAVLPPVAPLPLLAEAAAPVSASDATRASEPALHATRASETGPDVAPASEAAAPDAAPGRPFLVRPLIRARRADVLAHLERHGLAYAQDPSNENPRFARVRVRRELLPLLQDMAPAIVMSLCALSDMLVAGSQGETGELPELGRAQQQAIEHARRMGKRAVELRLRGGRQVDVTFPEGRIVLTDKA